MEDIGGLVVGNVVVGVPCFGIHAVEDVVACFGGLIVCCCW